MQNSCKLSLQLGLKSSAKPPVQNAARNYLGFAMAKRTKKVGITGKYGTRDLADDFWGSEKNHPQIDLHRTS
jgi:hypothetical protein